MKNKESHNNVSLQHSVLGSSPITTVEQLEKIYEVWLQQTRSSEVFNEELWFCTKSLRIEVAGLHVFDLRGNRTSTEEVFHPEKVSELVDKVNKHNEMFGVRSSVSCLRKSELRGYPTNFNFVFGANHINADSLEAIPSFKRDVIYVKPKSTVEWHSDDTVVIKIRDLLHTGNTLKVWASSFIKAVYPEVLTHSEPYTWTTVNFNSSHFYYTEGKIFNTPNDNLVYTLVTHQVDPAFGNVVVRLDGTLSLCETGHACLNVTQEDQGGCALSTSNAYNVDVKSMFCLPSETGLRYGFLIPDGDTCEENIEILHKHACSLVEQHGSEILERQLEVEENMRSLSCWCDLD